MLLRLQAGVPEKKIAEPVSLSSTQPTTDFPLAGSRGVHERFLALVTANRADPIEGKKIRRAGFAFVHSAD
jgi:hypothetical protein